MRCGRPLALCAFIALSLLNGVVSSRGIVRRQDSGITTTASGRVSSPSTTGVSREASNIPNTTGVKPETTGSAATQTTKNNAVPITTDAPVPTIAGSYDGSNTTISPEDAVYSGGLPIEPKVTPGIGIAGVILMLAGAPFCLVGIKLKVLQIFLSTFFLAGLGVTVLIIYVMNPPVSNAIQGAYVTAVAITGILTGCLAVVFPEVTEALGCLLGGFCVSMWFLVLKPGGLVTSIYGKLIVIAVFCFVTFSLAFHKVTRPYSLIFSISFAGATATVLGIDCFSRAGLKEFWIYIWALNDNIFPLGTNTYPHTRGIRVEIAVIILITAFGIMSQVKLWKILKERRNAKDAEKSRQVADLEALDEDVGRRVEEGHKMERAQWEVTYGGKAAAEVTVDERPNTGNMSRADSGIGDEDYRKKSGETHEEFVETEEMRREREEHIQMESRKQSVDVPGQPSTAQDDEIEEIDSGNGDSLTPGSTPRRQSPQSTRRQSPLSQRMSSQSQRMSSQSLSQPETVTEELDVSPVPEVIPLPVPIPIETEDDDDVSSLATWAESTRSLPEDMEVEIITTPMLVKPEEEDDRASSLAATCDEEDDALPAINEETERGDSPLSFTDTDGDVTPTRDSFGIPVNREAGGHTPEGKEMSFLPILDILTSNENGKDSRRSSFDKGMFTGNHSESNIDQVVPAAALLPSVADAPPPAKKFLEDLTPASSPKANIPAPPAISADFNPQLQAKCSKVVKNYRTNEWAKHLADAEKPELDQLEEIDQAVDTATEVSVPVHVKELQETSDVPSKPPPRSASKMSLYEVPVNSTPVPSNSFPTQNPANRPVVRKSSAPVIPPEDRQGSTSPVDRSVSPAGYGKRTPSPLPQNTLMGKRKSMVRNRHNFNTLPEYGPPALAGAPDLRSQSPNIGLIFHPSLNAPGNSRSPTPNMYPSANEIPQYRIGQLDDDMSLANRRNELVHRSVSQNALNGTLQQGRRSFTPQPQLTDKREAKLKTWRENIKSDLQTNSHTVHNIQERRGDMLTERQQLALAERQKSMKENFRDEMLDERMRQKDMLELHKEALRKMQAGANKHI